MRFIEAYKRLEKLCGEILGDEGRISAYIEEMKNIPDGSYYVSTWNEDLKKLKHYRWLRNKIVHDTDCTEANMCNQSDVKWINDFYSRILNETDPLALYRKEHRSGNVSFGVILAIVVAVIIAILVWIFLQVI